jgi:hypothetical protein
VLVRSYAQARLEFGLTYGARERAAAARAATLAPAIWSEIVQQVAPFRQSALTGFVVAPYNEAFETAVARAATLEARVPLPVLAALVLYLLGAAVVVGYALVSEHSRLRVASLAMFGLFALALALILDLDRPRNGAIRIPQGPMAETVRLMGGSPR